ncbi:hypothetical protein LOD99_7845 [Oopsacas minuta]|uniref:Uncharacterized protein n=1 Tax=Oopsacas minuta TaxID=111878 RepID=A0AAV7JQE8_9METZ|nr:hypothetical protein LOD99_7845 [Oopsacas minuta]
MHVDDENNEEYSQAMLDDVNEVLATMHTENDDSDDDSDDQSNASAPIENEVTFNGFEQLHRKVLEVEDQLLCTDVQAQAGDAYGELKDTFENFQRKLRQVASEAKRKRAQNMRQLTMHDMFKQ